MLSFITLLLGLSCSSPENYLASGSILKHLLPSLQEALQSHYVPRWDRICPDLTSFRRREGTHSEITTSKVGECLNRPYSTWLGLMTILLIWSSVERGQRQRCQRRLQAWSPSSAKQPTSPRLSMVNLWDFPFFHFLLYIVYDDVVEGL